MSMFADLADSLMQQDIVTAFEHADTIVIKRSE
jgi:hypothetical protein